MKLGEIRTGKELGRPSRFLRYIWHACEVCGKERWVQFYGGRPCANHCHQCAYLSREVKRGSANPFWKGGRRKDTRGYVVVNIQPDSPYYSVAYRGEILEHRLVMAQYLGRCLNSWEVIHHKNGIKDDNRLENLELLPSQSYHNTKIEYELKRQAERIAILEQRVIQLEAELVIRRKQPDAIYEDK